MQRLQCDPAGETHQPRSQVALKGITHSHPLCPLPGHPKQGRPSAKVAEAHLGTLLSSRARWSSRPRKPLQVESQLVIPYPRAAPSPASLLRTDVPECQANPGLQAPPASQKRQTGPHLLKPTCPTGRPGLGWAVCQPSEEHPKETLRAREVGVKTKKQGSGCGTTLPQSCALEHVGEGRAPWFCRADGSGQLASRSAGAGVAGRQR